jgi:3-isopropylmalate/(R)-2-methylmalate dehydratase large subunit
LGSEVEELGKTFAEKVLGAKAGKDVSAGEIVDVSPDKALSHDNTAAISGIFKKIGVPKVKEPEKLVIVLDHCVPAASEKYAENHSKIREFVREQGVKYFYDVGVGICHQVMAEKGHALPGTLVLGSDSHTTSYGALGAFAAGIGRSEMAVIYATSKIWLRVPETLRIEVGGFFQAGVGAKDLILKIIGDIGADGGLYRAVEYAGKAVERMSIGGRMVLCNMAAEMGAKIGYVQPDQTTEEWLTGRSPAGTEFESVFSDSDCRYDEVLKYDVSDLEPQIAKPHTVDNVAPVTEVAGTKIHQVLIGTCTNGRLEDIEIAAKILGGKKVHRDVRVLVFPASNEVYLDSIEAGYIKTLAEAGCVIMNAGCGPCLGAHEGCLAPGEVCLSTANRNFKGRMGCRDAEIYLSSPATAAASALEGEIVDFRRLGVMS